MAVRQQVDNAAISIAEYAGFWRRAFALVIDHVAISLACGILSPLLSYAYVPLVLWAMRGQHWLAVEGVMWAVVRLLPLALPVLPGWIYSAFMESSFRQATLGKMALGIVVTDLEGRKISFHKAARRYFVKVLFFGSRCKPAGTRPVSVPVLIHQETADQLFGEVFVRIQMITGGLRLLFEFPMDFLHSTCVRLSHAPTFSRIFASSKPTMESR